MTDQQLRAQLTGLHTALLCDVMDSLGFRDSALGMNIRPMAPTQKLVGTAFTMRCEAVDLPPAKPYQHLLAAYQDLRDGNVIVLQCAEQVSAMWGELLSTAAVAKGAVGAVMDGATRDIEQILQIGFPVFSMGFSPLDSAGRQEVVEHGTEIRCGNATVRPGDWVVGDIIGVVVIPRELLRGEEIGMVFARHGIL
jgi:4-hydroxy-4-methyl-2-oxoglutarate aldolase